MRGFLENVKIAGAMLVSRNVELLDITIPNMLKWCDWCLVLMDNESDEDRDKVYEIQRKYKGRLILRRSSIPSNLPTKSGGVMDYRKRWKAVKGIVRDDVFTNLKKISKTIARPGFDKIDILIWPDSDEIFTNHFPYLLKMFWGSDKKAITMKPVDVVGSMRVIKKKSMNHHVHVMKYSHELAGIPWRFHAVYYPLEREDLMAARYYSVHLPFLNEKCTKWRNENWKVENFKDCELYHLDQDVNEMSQEEIYKKLYKR